MFGNGTGKMMMVTEHELLRSILNNSEYMQKARVLYMADPEGQTEMLQRYNMIFPEALVPEFAPLEAIVNGDVQTFTERYVMQLQQPAAITFFTTIIAALYRGYDVVLYYPQDTLELYYPQFFMQYMSQQYGIMIGSPTTNFSIDMKAITFHASLLYMNNCISPTEYLSIVSDIQPMCLSKLIVDMHLPLNPEDVNDPNFHASHVLNWLSSYKKSMLHYNNDALVAPYYLEGDFKCHC